MGICQSKMVNEDHHVSHAPPSESSPLLVEIPKGVALFPSSDDPIKLGSIEARASRPVLKNPQQLLMDQLHDLLQRGGLVDPHDFSPLETASLSELLGNADNVQLLEKNDRGKKLLVEGQFVLAVRLALVERQWEKLAEHLTLCHRLNFDLQELRVAERTLEYHLEVEKTIRHIQEAIAASNIEELRSRLATLRSLQHHEHPQELAQAEQTLQDFERAVELLNQALLQKVGAEMKASLDFCFKISFCNRLVIQVGLLFAQILRIEEMIKIGLHYLVKSVLQMAVNEARSLSYHDELVQSAENILNLTETQFLNEQRKKAQADRNLVQIARISLQMKELFLKSHPGLFDWKKYPRFRSLEDFSSSYLFGRRKCAKSMLVWAETMPVSLIKLDDKALNKLSLRVFHHIRAWMDESASKRKSSSPSPVQEIINIGFQHATLRNEIFAQILKQLSENNNANSVHKGVELLAFILQSFPPAEDFDPYLETYLRSPIQHTKLHGCDVLLKMLHDAQFGFHQGGRSKQAPLISSLLSIKDYIPCVDQPRVIEIDSSFYDSLLQSRPQTLEWLCGTSDGFEIEALLAYSLPPDLLLKSPSSSSSTSSSDKHIPSHSQVLLHAIDHAVSPSTSSSSLTSSLSSSSMMAVDIEALLLQWDQMADELSTYQGEEVTDFGDSEDELEDAPRVEALYDFQATSPGKLSLTKGSILKLIGHPIEGGWVLSLDETSGQRGYIPENYVKEI